MKQRISNALLVGKRTVVEFTRHQGTDLAAALTYYAVLAIFPTLVAFTALLGIVGQAEESVDTMLEMMSEFASAEVLAIVEPMLRNLSQSRATGIALIIGLGGALWSASAYVNAFSRAMNRIFEVVEGRPIWKLRPFMLLITVVSIVLMAAAAVILVVSGEIAEEVGSWLGLQDSSVRIWNIAKWPALGLLVIFLIALLYWATPNVRHKRFRWLTPGTVLTLLVALLASAGFGFYISNFGSYDRTYGSLAGVIVFLLFLWIMNNVLLLGAQLDAEVTRMYQLKQGLISEERIQLPLRDTSASEKKAQAREKLIEDGREIRSTSEGLSAIAAAEKRAEAMAERARSEAAHDSPDDLRDA